MTQEDSLKTGVPMGEQQQRTNILCSIPIMFVAFKICFREMSKNKLWLERHCMLQRTDGKRAI